ncbi:MAG: CRISPR-associated protein Cas4 [Desulfurococcaceae archaeon]
MYRSSNIVVKLMYEKIVSEQLSKLEEARSPYIIYVTDLVLCTHKFHMRKHYPELTLTFEPVVALGSIAHWGMETLFKEKGIEVEVEVSRTIRLDDKVYTIKGRVDAIDRAGGVVIEVKTARSSMGIPKEHHIKQLNIYLELTGFEQGILVYITPDKVVEYSVTRKPIDLELEARGLVEDCYHPRYSWECTYCVYRKLCPYYVPEQQRRT